MGIQFTYPAVLYGLLLIIIPIIIHLFSFRKHQHIYFHSTFLLQESLNEQNRTKTKLKELLVLISRILAIIFLVLAFAQPFIPAKTEAIKQNNSNVTIYIDNSFSAQGESKNGLIIETEKAKAQAIIEALPTNTNYQILTNSFAATDNNSLTKDLALKKVSEISISSHTKLLSDIYSRTQSFKQDESKSLYVISDFQNYSTNLSQIVVDSNISVKLIPVESYITNNISIDSVWFETPYRKINQAEKIHIQLSNTANQDYVNHPISLYIQDTLKSISSFTIEANSTKNIELEYTIANTGLIAGKVSIEDYPLIFDNDYYFSYTISKNIKVLEIFEQRTQTYLKNLLETDKYIEVTQMLNTEIDYSQLQNFDAIILHGITQITSGLSFQIKDFIESGKTVIIIPNSKIDIDSYNSSLAEYTNQTIEGIDTANAEISIIDFKHRIINSLFEEKGINILYPKQFEHYLLIPNNNNAILSFANKHPFLVEYTYHDGNIFLFTSDLTPKQGEFVSHPLLMSIYNMVLQIKNYSSLQSNIGNVIRISKTGIDNTKPIHIINTEHEIDIIPQILNQTKHNELIINCFDAITKAGIYSTIQDSTTFSYIAINYNRKESNMEYIPNDDLQNEIAKLGLSNFSIVTNSTEEIGNAIIQNDLSTPLWRIALLLAFIFIGIEIALLKMLS